MSELFNKKEYLKNLILRVEKGDEKLKDELKKTIESLSAEEIAQVEQELMEEEGLTVEKIQSVCDVHLELFKDYIDSEKIEVEEWHPINILMKEHEKIISTLEELKELSKKLIKKEVFADAISILLEVQKYIDELQDAEKYFLKEENVLFPYLEKYGITKPPAVMWKEHDEVRQLRKELLKVKESRDFEHAKKKLYEISLYLLEFFLKHVHKEHSVLFPTSLKLINKEEWMDIREQFDEIGYIVKTEEFKRKTLKEEEVKNGKVKFPSGELTIEELKYILNTLPVDMTFVDKNDEVKYFSETKDRIFVRSRAIIGRKVQNCHPEKSIEIVNKILMDFKSGKRDIADFWLRLGERYVYIRYFAVRNEKGKYLGTLEVTQDIKPIQEIKGEKRIYDEK
ncbi:hemerythrin [Thermosipho melanesiensis]|nr:DUF438 domain-containing protein [Thermosipho melanesiensis]APT73758.1 hemerythrin [Thermosipho melanesiensis]OOC36755.1 hemerythrin [Thermosipho melanesiensis]OOC39087.1 hemerythrin [Thermosipho melanesiensis]OOC39235.1 hemerythrin [Thermosipho melanesiensis]OOC41762.1 hemerythrin [Thermosipho melanesiensis]